MPDAAVKAPVMKQARRRPLLGGLLGDQVLRKIKVEFVGSHTTIGNGRPPRFVPSNACRVPSSSRGDTPGRGHVAAAHHPA
jgi:hypothetical protein